MADSFETHLSSLLQTLKKGGNTPQVLDDIQRCQQKLEELRQAILQSNQPSDTSTKINNFDEISINLHWGC